MEAESVMVFNMALNEVVASNSDEDAQLLNETNNVIPELANLWQTQQFMDVELVCSGRVPVKAHKLVLAAVSPVFRMVFCDDFSPEVDCTIMLPETDPNALRHFLQSLYLGDTSVAVIDDGLEYLKFSGEPITEPIGSSGKEALKDLLNSIKAEPPSSLQEVEEEDVDFEVTTKVLKKSRVWRLFDRLDKEMATCKACGKTVKTQQGNTTGMSRHIVRAHPNLHEEVIVPKEEPLEVDNYFSTEPLDTAPATAKASTSKSKKSKVWNFFDRVEKDIARCKTCSVVIKTQNGNTSGMSRHLFRVHLEVYSQLEALKEKEASEDSDNDKDDDDDDFSPLGMPKKSKKARKRANQKRSKVWQFFEQQMDGTDARCNFCNTMIKTEMGNTSGLISHLRSSHPDQYDELNTMRGADIKVSTSGARNSPVWQFYSELGSNRVKCVKCDVVLKYYYGTTSGLLRHLKRTHLEDYETIKSDENENGDALNEAAAAAALEVDSQTIWKFFQRAEGGKANCVECMAEVSNQHGSLVSSCEEHLRGSHTDLLEQYESQRKAHVQELIKTDKTAIKRKYTSRVMASAIWSFFKKTDNAVMNQCLTCLVEIDCSQNTTAMVKHLEDVHPEQHESFKKTSGIEAKDIKKPSAIWKHFQITTDPKKHKCLACSKEILCHYQTTSNMIRHLEHNHSNLYEEFLRESHGLEQTEDIMPLLKKPKKRQLNMKGDNDPCERTCPDCGKEYSCRPAMLFHFKCVHSGIRPYKCEECGMTFARQDSWKGHTHSKIRSFLCSICGKTFARRNIRDTHERAHLNDRRYPCSFCGKKFMTNQQRTNHERTHTGEKPFQCTDCGRQFAQQHQLTTHTRIHTGDKPYSCVCGQKFRHLSSRNNHKCDAKVTTNNPPQNATTISVSWNS